MKNLTKEQKAILDRARDGDVSVLQIEGADDVTDEYGASPLHLLAQRGCKEVLSHPRVAAWSTDMLGRSPLHWLADAGVADVIKHRSSAEIFDLNGQTPLHLLARSGCKAALEHSQVAFVETKDTEGHKNTPLHFLATRKVIECLEHPMVATAKNWCGRTPLHVLAQGGCLEVLRHKNVGGPSPKDSWGETPLHVLARGMYPGVLEHKRAESIKNKEGKTPGDIYREQLRLHGKTASQKVEAEVEVER